MKKILILNGPNINLTGIREKGIYGAKTYDDLLAMCQAEAEKYKAYNFCGRNWIGLICKALSERAEEALDMLAEIITKMD